MKKLLLPLLLALAGCADDAQVVQSQGEVKEAGKFPHAIWTGVLKKVNKGGFIDYKALLADRKEFDEYLGFLAKYSPDANPDLFPRREDKLAYLINAYNAYTMRGVIDRYPLKSVNGIGSLGKGFWIDTAYPIGPLETFTLYKLEKKIQEMGEPRIHFAINCASLGCPRLPEEAFEADRLEEQLAREAKKFVNEERNVQVDGKTVRLSSIFKWYKGDFTDWQEANGQPEDILAYVKSMGRAVPADAKIEHLEYGWGLNEQGAEK
jgi:hypothetical protein